MCSPGATSTGNIRDSYKFAHSRHRKESKDQPAVQVSAAKQSVKQKETSKGNWWDNSKNLLFAAGIVAKAAICTVSQPLLNAASFVSGALSAAADDLGFTASQLKDLITLPIPIILIILITQLLEGEKEQLESNNIYRRETLWI